MQAARAHRQQAQPREREHRLHMCTNPRCERPAHAGYTDEKQPGLSNTTATTRCRQTAPPSSQWRGACSPGCWVNTRNHLNGRHTLPPQSLTHRNAQGRLCANAQSRCDGLFFSGFLDSGGEQGVCLGMAGHSAHCRTSSCRTQGVPDEAQGTQGARRSRAAGTPDVSGLS